MPANRRTLLAAVAGLPAVLGPRAVIALPAPAGPDAELIALCERRAALLSVADELGQRHWAVWEAVHAAHPKPDALKRRPTDTFGEPQNDGYYGPGDVGNLRWGFGDRGSDQAVRWRSLYPDERPRARQIVAAYTRWNNERDAALQAADYDRLEAAWDAVLRDVTAVEGRILATPARTPEGLRAKARVALAIMDEPDGTYEDHAARSVLADLIGEASAGA